MTPVNIILSVAGSAGVLSALDSVRGSLGGIAAAALGTTSALAGVKSGLDLGGQLNDLSARTGQTVRDLVIVRRALDNAGIGGESAAQYIGLLQKAISGLNEEGGKTDGVFKRLGLDPDQLKNLGVKDQLDALVAGFSKIQNPAERAGLAMQLFGRNGAQMLQLLGDSSAMTIAAREAGRLAQRLQENSAAFDEVGDRLSLAKTRMQEFWVVAAEKALPTLQKMADVLESINPGPLAAAAGNVATIFAAAGAAKVVGMLDKAVLAWAASPTASSAGKAFAGSFLAPMTGGLAKVLPVGLAAVITYNILAGITNAMVQWKVDRDRAENDAANAGAKESQRQRDALRNAQSLADLDAQRKKTAADIASLESLAKTQQIGTNRSFDSDNGRSGRTVYTPVFGLTEAQRQQMRELQALQKIQDSDRAKIIVATNQQVAADAKKLTDAQKIVEELKKQATEYQKAAEAAKLAIAPEEEKLKILDRQAGKVLEQYFADVRAADLQKDDVARRAATAKFEATSLDIAKQRRDVEKTIADEKKKQADAEAAAAEKAKQAALELQRTKAEIAKTALENRQLEIQRELNKLSADFSHTDAEKWAERKRRLEEAVTAANAYLKTMQEQRRLAQTPEQVQLADANVHAANQDVFQAESQLSGVGPNPNSYFEQMQAGLAQLRASWGTTAQTMSSVMTGAFESSRSASSDFLYNVLSGAQTTREAWNNALLSVGQSFLRMTTDAVTKLIWRSTVERGLIALGVITHTAGETAKTTATVTGSGIRLGAMIREALADVYHGAIAAFKALAGIPYVGPFLAGAAMAAALAGGIALVGKIGGHEQGGLVRGGKQLSWLNESGDEEFVWSAPAVKAIGADTLSAMHDAAKSGDMSAFSSAAPVANAGSASSGRDDLRTMLGDFAGRIQIVQVNSEREATRVQRRGAAAGDVVAIVRDNWGSITKRGAGS